MLVLLIEVSLLLATFAALSFAQETEPSASNTTTSSAPAPPRCTWNTTATCYCVNSTEAVMNKYGWYTRVLDKMTVQACQEECRGSGYTHAGVDKGNRCTCSTGYLRSERKDEPQLCKSKCIGGKDTDICGGEEALTVYVYDKDAWKSDGCYNNSRTPISDSVLKPTETRELKNTKPGNLTVVQCLDFCQTGYAGIEAGEMCYCSETIVSNPQLLSSKSCTVGCTFEKQEQCGAEDAFALFQCINSGSGVK